MMAYENPLQRLNKPDFGHCSVCKQALVRWLNFVEDQAADSGCASDVVAEASKMVVYLGFIVFKVRFQPT